jgi:hypothetical protein
LDSNNFHQNTGKANLDFDILDVSFFSGKMKLTHGKIKLTHGKIMLTHGKINKINEATDGTSSDVRVLIMDYRKAFDLIDHSLLIT